MPPDTSPSWWRDPNTGLPSAERMVSTPINKALDWFTTPTLKGPTLDEIMQDPSLQSTRNVMRSMSSPFDLLSGFPGGGTELAVMLPFLRGNKALQASRLANLKLPKGASPEAIAHFEQMKARYPRFYSHQDEIGTAVNPGAAGSQLGGLLLGPVDPTTGAPGFQAWKSNININPDLLQPDVPPEILTQVIGHESRHGAQQLLNQRGLKSTQGRPYAADYFKQLETKPYSEVSYEVGARLGGTKDLVRQVIGEERWRNLPPRMRNTIAETLETIPEYNAVREAAVFGPIDKAPMTDTRKVQDLINRVIENTTNAVSPIRVGPKRITSPSAKIDVTPNKPFQGVQERAKINTAPNQPKPHWEQLADSTEHLGPQVRTGPSDEMLQKQYEGYLENPALGRREMAKPKTGAEKALQDEEDMKAFIATLRAKGIDPIKNPKKTAEMYQKWKEAGPIAERMTPQNVVVGPQITDPRRLLGPAKLPEQVVPALTPDMKRRLDEILELAFDPWAQTTPTFDPASRNPFKTGERQGAPMKAKSAQVEGKWKYKNRSIDINEKRRLDKIREEGKVRKAKK